MRAKALAATPITATDCKCCLVPTQMYALGVYICIQTESLPRYHLTLHKRAARSPMRLAKADIHAWMAHMHREKRVWSEFSGGWCPYMNGLQALALLLKLVLLLFQLAVAHAATLVEAGAHCLQPLAQDQRLERAC